MPLTSEQLSAAYEQYAPRLRAFCAQRLPDPGLAEDVVSQVFVEAVAKAECYEDRGLSVSAWLYSIARSRCTDAARHAARRPTAELSSVLSDATATERLTESEARLEVTAQLVSLSPRKRQIMEMLAAGQSRAHIAAALGLTPSLVKKDISMARKQLAAPAAQGQEPRKEHALPGRWRMKAVPITIAFTGQTSSDVVTAIALAGGPARIYAAVPKGSDRYEALATVAHNLNRDEVLTRIAQGVYDLGPKAPPWACLLRKYHATINAQEAA